MDDVIDKDGLDAQASRQTAISFALRVWVPADVLMQELGGEAVLLNLKSEAYFGLDDVGTRMWQVLISAKCIEDAFGRLLLEYDVEEESLRRDLEELLEKLVHHGLVELRAV